MAKIPLCRSCGKPFSDHLGIEGTCRRLLAEQKRTKELREALGSIVEADIRKDQDRLSDALARARKVISE